MRRRDSDLLSLVRPQAKSSRLSYSYSQCSSRSRSGSFESDVRWSERASSIAPSDLDGSELLDLDDLHLLQQQKQNGEERETVRVTVRFRPLLPKEKSKSSAWTVHAETGTVEAAAVSGQNARRRGVYAFDEVYDAQHSTRAIYDGLARSIARSALDGIHGSIFAYGQTSSGKTHTMQGTGMRRRMTLVQENKVETEEHRRPEDSDGLVQLAVKDLFDEMARRSDVEYLVRVSYLEVYNETVKDLLMSGTTASGKKRDSTVHIREHPVTGVFTDNSERVVADARGVLQALRDGEKQRAVGVTRMNERSSRSHSIFRVVIESKTRLETPVTEDEGVERVRVGCLNFVDLAGSESARAVSSGGKRLTTESGNINRSLLALSRVVVALGSSKPSQQDHINFRDSKLTRILQPSLSGAARVLFVCCASPAPTYIEDTRSTLKFASRAKRIKVNAAVNEVVDQRSRALMELARENQVLRQQLEALASASRDEMDAMEEHAVRLRMRVVSLEAAAAAPAWTSSVVITPASDSPQKTLDRQPEVTGLEGANSPVDSDTQVLEIDLSDEEDTDVDSQFDSPTGSPLLVADAACPTCETLDDALEIAKTRELASYLRIEQLEEEVAQLQREHEEGHKRTAVETEEDSIAESQCVLDIDDEETDETKALSGNEESGVSSIVHASSLSLASAALLAVVVDALKKRSPTEALAIMLVAVACMGIMLASFAWNIATATL
ncbi:Kinesin-like protein KIN-7D [Phytophthora citrophthora]|uniref:Kinesin-like protein KIN-7D n=1 Tax=Phytophthora citrophthora TaxID=4793 RepID=A0AAD9G5W7_9STRA|nr:Kinesin-like protein KIN-7D [Phytophthora citrophthora]